jgi:hypothetical protein
MTSWVELQRKFRHLVLRRRGPMQDIARKIKTDRVTVYRLMKGETKRPHRATMENVERLVEEQEESSVQAHTGDVAHLGE